MAHQFLSDDWFDAGHEIRARYEGKTQPIPHKIKMNQVITDVPFGDGQVKIYMDSSDGQMNLERGELSDAELTVTVDWATAKALLVDQNPQAGMQAFMSGKIKVQGDMTKMMAMQASQATPDEVTKQIAAEIKAITAE